MRYLLDTHVLYWTAFEPSRLPKAIKQVYADPHNQLWVSVVTLWEFATKRHLKKIGYPDYFFAGLESQGYNILPVDMQHIVQYQALPFYPKHRDPFDRMLVAQAGCEKLTLMTHDKQMQQYEIKLLLA